MRNAMSRFITRPLVPGSVTLHGKRAQHLFRSDRQIANAHADRIFDRVGHSRRYRQRSGFTDALCAEWTGLVRHLDDDWTKGHRQILERRYLIIEQRAVDELPLVKNHFFKQCQSKMSDRRT